MKVDFENYGEVVSPLDFTIVARTHVKFSYSISILMVVHFESVRLENMGRTLENLIEMMSRTCFEIVALFHKRLPNSFLTRIFLQLVILEKGYIEFDVGRIVNRESFEFVLRTQA